ncbi:MAG: hypothetical protein ACI9O0_001002 [Paracoccaceae bacterium]|jgi:hypothetical protein
MNSVSKAPTKLEREAKSLLIKGPIVTDSFILRSMRKSDLGLVNKYASDIRVAQMTRSIPHPLPPGAAEAFVVRAMADASTEAKVFG